MKNRWLAHLMWTAIASPAFLFLIYLLNDIKPSGVYETLFMPGVTLDTWLGGMDGHMPDLGILLLSEIVFYWILLFAGTAMIEFVIYRKSTKA